MKGADGATTVAGTAFLASLVGVKVFVTGGMGGVHRGAETTFDVSSDLAELAQTPIVVVCAGVKSILDIEKTLEVSAVDILLCLLCFLLRFLPLGSRGADGLSILEKQA